MAIQLGGQHAGLRSAALMQGFRHQTAESIDRFEHLLQRASLCVVATAANFSQQLHGRNTLGRLVITHSTYVEGLIPWLKALASDEAIQTITPGVIARVRGRSPELRLRVSTPMRGGFKVVARRGTSVQEVFVVTRLLSGELEQRIEACQPQTAGKTKAVLR